VNNIKKVGLLTFHRGYNYGASLQCYALLKKIKDNNIPVEVIDFYKKKKYGNKRISFNLIARNIYNFFYKKQLEEKKNRFDLFNENLLTISEIKNIFEDDIYLKKINFDKYYEKIVFGSDQIWNLDKKIYDRSDIYYGDFDFSGNKVAYAASFGDDLDEEKNNINFIKKNLRKFTSISVREESAMKFLEQIGIESKVVVDPTLLLEKEEWYNIIPPERIIEGKYILYYSVNCRKYSWNVAKKISKATGLKVINLTEHPKIIRSGFKNYYKAGPLEFLNILKNAEYVVTNSFHGTVFSALFNKKLVVAFDDFEGEIIKEERKYNLLEKLFLLDRIKTKDKDIDINNIQHCDCDEQISHLREFSNNYLIQILK